MSGDTAETMRKTICIQGNIGSGKSTLVRHLEEAQSASDKYVCMQEPVNVWSEYQMNGKNILEKFYEDRKAYAFPFQMMAFYTRLKAMRALPTDRTVIMERSVDTDKRIFAQMMIDDGSIDPICARIYNEWFTDLAEDKTLNIVNVYIRTPPTVCHQRVNKRGRSGEEGITLEYLQRCHDLHDSWLMGNSYVIDGTLPTSAIMEKVTRLLN